MAQAPLRSYQERIVNTTLRANTVVLLPTGAGKTFIAAEAITRMNRMALFFVPTVPLVNQQASALRSRPGMPLVGEYHGEKEIPRNGFQVLVTTPKAFHTAQARGEKLFSWSRFGVVIFDEVHHVIKDHPYRVLAIKLKQSNCNPRIIGLTASLTYSVGADKIAKSVDKLCKELQIECIEHAEDDELQQGGYTGAGRGSVAEVRLPSTDRRNDIVPRDKRKPHLMHATFFSRIRNSEATSFSCSLVEIIRHLEKVVHTVDSRFVSPLDSSSLKKWGKYANGRVTVHSYYDQLQYWYEALRLLITSWEEGEDATVTFLRMMNCQDISSWPNKTGRLIRSFFGNQPISFVRFENMRSVLSEKIRTTTDFRGILFVQQRIMTHILLHTIEQDPALNGCINARCLYATTSPASSTLAISSAEAKETLREFRNGEANLLITTSVAEEGLDIPAANCVIYFDPMNHAVSYVQGRGRARQANSSFVMLDQREDRPADMLARQEVQQHLVASSFTPSTSQNEVIDIRAQKDRERNALALLSDISEETALSKLNLFCKKTKVTREEILEGCNQKKCKMVYKSVLRTVSADAVATSGKAAKKKAATKLLRALKNSISMK